MLSLQETLRRQLKRLEEDNETLRRENTQLKALIRETVSLYKWKVPAEITLPPPRDLVSWTDRSKEFDTLRKQLLEVVIALVTSRSNTVHTDDVIKAFHTAYPTVYTGMSNPGETLPRRLRELREAGYLTSPQPGYWFLTPKSGGKSD